jgi:UDP-glucose 4-epimerase
VGGDLLDTRRLAKALEGTEVVFHLAARVTTPFADADLHGFDQVNHWGSAELGYLLEKPGCSVRRLVYLSSTAVYGESETAVQVGDPAAPVSAYGGSKFDGERMLERLSENLALHIPRCANVYGYNRAMRFDAVINRFVFDAHYRGRIEVHGSGEQRRAFVHVDNLVHALAGAVHGKLPLGRSHVVGRNLSVNDILGAVQALEPESEVLYIRQHQRLRDLVVAPDPRVDLGAAADRGLLEQLHDLRARFSFVAARD